MKLSGKRAKEIVAIFKPTKRKTVHGLDENVIDNRLDFLQSENSVLSQSRQAVVAMATIHLFLIAEKSGIGSDNGGCYDNKSSLSYRGNLTTEQRRQSMLSQHRCLAE